LFRRPIDPGFSTAAKAALPLPSLLSLSPLLTHCNALHCTAGALLYKKKNNRKNRPSASAEKH